MRFIPKIAAGTWTEKFGPFVDSTDGFTPEPALSITAALTRLSKNGGAFGAKNDATAGAHDENGYYGVVFNTTDISALGKLLVAFNITGALPVWEELMVVPQGVYDMMITAAGGKLTLSQLKLAADDGTIPLDIEAGATCGEEAVRIRALGTAKSEIVVGKAAGNGAAVDIDKAGGYDALSLKAAGAGVACRVIGGAFGVRLTSDNIGVSLGGGAVGSDGHAVQLVTGDTLDATALRLIGPATLRGKAMYAEGGHGVGSKVVELNAPTGRVVHLVAADTGFVHLDASGASGGTYGFKIESENAPAVDIDADNGIGVDIDADGPSLAMDTASGDAVSISTINGDGVQISGTQMGVRLTGVTKDIDADEIDNLLTRLGTPATLGTGATIADNMQDIAGAGFVKANDSLVAIRARGDVAWITGTGDATAAGQAALAALIGSPAVDLATDIAAVDSNVSAVGAAVVAVGAAVAVVDGKVVVVDGKIGTPPDLGSGATLGFNMTDLNTAVLANAGLDDIKDLMFNRDVITRWTNQKPKQYTAGLGGNQITVDTTQDGSGNTETETIAP
jgi:hypothetical protein